MQSCWWLQPSAAADGWFVTVSVARTIVFRGRNTPPNCHHGLRIVLQLQPITSTQSLSVQGHGIVGTPGIIPDHDRSASSHATAQPICKLHCHSPVRSYTQDPPRLTPRRVSDTLLLENYHSLCAHSTSNSWCHVWLDLPTEDGCLRLGHEVARKLLPFPSFVRPPASCVPAPDRVTCPPSYPRCWRSTC